MRAPRYPHETAKNRFPGVERDGWPPENAIQRRLVFASTDKPCAECHHKIDPRGFSLEAFDPIGRWRTTYPKPKKKDAPAPAIDTTGEFPSGETYQDFAGFKEILRKTREDLFIRHLIGEMLSYSTGRLMESTDDFVIQDIHEKAKQQGLGLRTIIAECLTSEIFRSR